MAGYNDRIRRPATLIHAQQFRRRKRRPGRRGYTPRTALCQRSRAAKQGRGTGKLVTRRRI